MLSKFLRVLGIFKIVPLIQKFIPYHAGLRKFCSESELTLSLKALIDEEVILFKDKANLKPPRGYGFKPHQDSATGGETYSNFLSPPLFLKTRTHQKMVV